MNIKRIKLLLAPAFGLCLMGLSQTSVAGWNEGACPQPWNGPGPCIERVDTGVFQHLRAQEDQDWHGPFSFSGEPIVSCGIASTCEMTFESNIRAFRDNNDDWKIGLQIVNATVGPGNTPYCDTINLGGFPWFLGGEDRHEYFGPNTGMEYSYPLMGNLGDVDYTAYAGLIDIKDVHLHDIGFNNDGGAPSYLVIDSDLYEGSVGDIYSGCSLSGDLIISDYDDLNIY